MKICSNCGASNPNSAKFCNECGTALAPVEQTPTVKSQSPGQDDLLDADPWADSIATIAQELQAKRKADVMFVLDCTGSMQGEIDAIKDAITAFADTIESDGVRVRVGLVEFRDRLINEEHRVLTFNGEPFTQDPGAFRREVSVLRAYGGGDEPESSLDAIMLALRQPFATDGNKVIVLVTDAPPHLPDKETTSIEEVLQGIRDADVQQFYLVVRTQHPGSQIYLKLIEGTRGLAFELGKGDDFRSRAEDFKRTLMSLGKTISAATR
ncbi:MAG: VWA domain-containing protein [Symploca sp. SIO1B1]|nr:VWA domain-containing protein [Symploca sp. SIO1B1]